MISDAPYQCASCVLEGNILDNTINGLGGNGTLNGGAGNDTLNGGEGNDTADYSQIGQSIW
ncbi:hypothetical protein PN492_12680 [Dolichospermum circinale CS-537/01]|uniref:Hemolysin-type calcium-binding region n=2 Tax=Dolichospermum circinale TaxID=109265 RepID=A0ABT5A8A1_9CYAN|nr:hypothetical protein [Dolichospermum circinale]MDB9487392.1 hypothetical protein [Dolichospermum circinale CS-537/01]